ncbi:pulmonary surfactant-associated protein D-like [Diabrotica virgifera virgifera]|uniref:C-type lectin domain-containing protein n=2 Tax=Diabrotica virgifera virgifera TaxID=50390 RepID=A0ABM5L0C8_DIAVI|nr:pulmonary surfactant-associated protein D-like [Diabrotica virgifera virgifera]
MYLYFDISKNLNKNKMYHWCVVPLLFIFPLVLGATKGNCASCGCKVNNVPPVITYKLLTTPVTYKGAVAACAAAGMELASIQSREKNEGVNAALHASPLIQDFWISGYKYEKQWFWLKGEAMVFTNWGSGEPNNARGNEDCVVVFKSGTGSFWNDQVCEVKNIPLCEKVVAP